MNTIMDVHSSRCFDLFWWRRISVSVFDMVVELESREIDRERECVCVCLTEIE